MSLETGLAQSDALMIPSMKEQKLCLLLQLPAELRIQIYQYLLTCSETQLATLRPLTTRKHMSTYLLPSLNICPNILRTCHQIHDEAAVILYKSNMFCAHPTQLISCPFLVASDRVIHYSRYKDNIRKWYISLRMDIDPRLRAKDVETAFTGVDTLEIEAWQAMFGSGDPRVLKLFEGVRGVGKVKVYGSVGQRYSDWLTLCMKSPLGSVVEPFVEDTQWDAWTHGNR